MPGIKEYGPAEMPGMKEYGPFGPGPGVGVLHACAASFGAVSSPALRLLQVGADDQG